MQQKKQQKQGKRQKWKYQMKESDRMLKGNVLLEKPQWVLMLTLAAEFLLLVVLHVLVNTFIRFCKGHLSRLFFLELPNDFLSSSSSSVHFFDYCGDCSSNIERISVSQCFS